MSNSKTCPYCFEQIHAQAIKCKHCGTMLTDAPPSSGSVGGITLVRQALSGRYEIQEEIGRGGMATVYRAVQKNLNRPVALKVIHQNLVHDTEFVARFHREAQVCASLQHPNIVTVYDEGELGGVHFMAMELLDGHDLHRIIRQQGQLSVEQTLTWLAPIAEALQYAHSRGIIHRDIKSSNILVTKTGRPVLMDFGIAHAASGTRLTQTGLVIGTPEYMSPEQAEGKVIDQRTDIYSLGIVLYECLTGKVPFKADNPLSIIMKVVNEVPVPPINLNRGIPDWVNHLVLQCLSKKSEDRFRDAGQLAQALTKQKASPQQGTPKRPQSVGTPRPDSPVQAIPQAAAPVKRSNTALNTIIWLLVIVLLSLGGIYGYRYYEQANSAYRYAQSQHTVQAYEQYLYRYGWTDFSGEIENRLNRLREQERQVAASLEKERQQAERQEAEARRIAEEQRRNDLFRDQMVFVRGGTFTMGCTSEQCGDCASDEKPTRRVTVSDFYIGKYEVTQKQWRDVMGSNPSHFKNCDNCPVENVSWNDVQGFIRKLYQLTGKRYRLPTEAEWEFAARGGTQSRGFKYAGSNSIGDVAWYSSNSDGKTRPVGGKKPNELGLYDMSGNVWEWCEDDWHGSYSGAPTDGRAWVDSPRGSGRVLRGGSWDDYARNCRVSNRGNGTPGGRSNFSGFRLAQSP